MIDSRRILGLIVEKYGTQTVFAKEIGINRANLSVYLSGKKPLPYNVMSKVIEKLNIPDDEVGCIFFKR